MKKFARVAAIALAAVLMLVVLTGCTNSGVKKTISSFESACQSLDVRGMLECVNPTISKPLLGALNLLGVEDTSGLLDDVVNALGMFDNAGESTEEFVKSIQIKPSDYAFNGDKDECDVTATLSYGESKEKEITIHMILKNDVWYISKISF